MIEVVNAFKHTWKKPTFPKTIDNDGGALVKWFWEEIHVQKYDEGSSGQVDLGGDSRSKGCVFKSQHHAYKH